MASSILTAFPILLLTLFHLLLATDSVPVPTRTTQPDFHFRANMTRASSSNASSESLVKANLKDVYTMTLAIGTHRFGKETLTIWDKDHPGVIFACGIPSNSDFEYDGIVGLGRGKLSLVSQLNQRSIEYCIPGSKAAFNGFPDLKNVQIMPLLEQE
ncbi:aspartic proteinase nepenthesin-1-like protein, partial [Tanacetum coccineum]